MYNQTNAPAPAPVPFESFGANLVINLDVFNAFMAGEITASAVRDLKYPVPFIFERVHRGENAPASIHR